MTTDFIKVVTFSPYGPGHRDEPRNVTLHFHDGETTLLGNLEHNTKIVIDQALVDQLQKIVNANEWEKAVTAVPTVTKVFVPGRPNENISIVTDCMGTAYGVNVIPGKSIQIKGTYPNRVGGPYPYDKTFKIGDPAEYHSYNLKYVGKITNIGPKTVTIVHYPDDPSSKKTRLTLAEFAWRNYDFDLDRINRDNSEELMCI